MPSPIEIEDAKTRRRRQEDKLAQDVIDEARVQLMLKFRFLDLALWRMGLEPLRAGMRYPMATDAEKIYFDPPRVLGRFQQSFEESVRDYLHMIMHCIFRHPFDEDHKNLEAWWLTCDIIVESVVLDMCGGRFESPDDGERRDMIGELKVLCGTLTPNKLYALLRDAVIAPENSAYMGLSMSKIQDMHVLFERDNHEPWPANSPEGSDVEGESEGVPQDLPESPDQHDLNQLESGGMDEPDEGQTQEAQQMDADPSEPEQQPEDEPEGEDAEDGGDEDSEVNGDDSVGDQPEPAEDDSEQDRDREQQEKDWEEVAKQIEMNLETFAKEWGDEAGSLIASLQIANRKTYDYADFLRRFMTASEEMKINQDEFDYIYYTYGMDMYGNMPFVEPLEYMDSKRIHDFCVVIDTSESVNGPLVKRFVEHTFNILKESEGFNNEVNIHVIQCDSKIQMDTKITNLKDVDRMMENFYIRGFGGTDFRPAFDYVETLRSRGELRDMRGIIYFTDGLGQFPEATPDYDAAFVFMDGGEKDLPPVPPWAMKVVIDEAGINRIKSSYKG